MLVNARVCVYLRFSIFMSVKQSLSPMSVKPCCWFSITDVSSSSSSSPQSAILAGGMHCSKNRSSSSSSMSMFSGGQRSSPLSTSLTSVGSTTMEGKRSFSWSWSRLFRVVSGPRTTSTGSGKIWRQGRELTEHKSYTESMFSRKLFIVSQICKSAFAFLNIIILIIIIRNVK